MIRLEAISKRFAPHLRPAVDDLSLDVPEGSICVLIGPSGCGKTTTMRMVNRLIEPTEGRIFVAGEDVMGMDPVALRRRIGYVIQQIGLFPHMSVADNVATVPRLLGWPRAKIESRIDELLEVVTRVKAVGAASLTLLQTIKRGHVVLVEAEVTVVLISVSGKPLRISSALREAFGAQ